MADAAEEGHRDHTVLVVVAAVVAFALLVGGLVLVGVDRGPTAPPRDRPAEAATTARAWLRAWAADDRPKLRKLVAARVPTFDATLDEFRRGLRVEQLTATPGLPVLTGDTATVPYDATVTVRGLGPWTYQGSLALVDVEVPDGGRKGDVVRRWRVGFTPAVLHPDLVDGKRLERSLTWSPRGALQLTDGAPLVASGPMRTIAGTTGPATAAQAATLGPAYEAGDVIGQSGLQAEAEHLLAGTPSGEVHLLQGTQVVKVETTFPGTPGQPVRSTLDPRILAAANAALGVDGNPAAIVAIQPSTGAIRAFANRPSNGFNRAFTGRYPPGSTFKVITTMALLANGVTPDTRISCPKELVVNGRTFGNAEDEELGDIPFRTAFAQSCNTAFIQLAQRLKPADLETAARALGFETPPNIGVPAALSQFPTPRGMVDQVSAAIGQGRILVTPLQMAAVAATVAAGGYRPPRLIEVPEPPALVPLPAGTAETLQALMRLVVTIGTGKKARLPGTPVAGKTGTAEFGNAVPLQTHAWFIAFRGDLALAVIVEDGGFGGDAAAPIAADVFRRVGG